MALAHASSLRSRTDFLHARACVTVAAMATSPSKAPPRWPAYRRIPPFVPVPLRGRRDGWTLVRQGEFIGWLAQTGCVAEAAARVGCSRESAYRLRRREGARGFAAAWDCAVSAGEKTVGEHLGGDQIGGGHIAPARKFTPEERMAAAFTGLVRVIMRRGRYVGCAVEVSDSALLGLMAQLDRSRCGQGWELGREAGAGRW